MISMVGLTMLRNSLGDADGKGDLGLEGLFDTGGGQRRALYLEAQVSLCHCILEFRGFGSHTGRRAQWRLLQSP